MNKKKLPKAVTKTASEMRLTPAMDEVSAKVEMFPAVARRKTEAPSAQRQTQANCIVERYANFSALGGVVPLPLVNVATVTVIILQMVKKLCKLYGVPYEQGRARALVVGLAGGAVPTAASAVTTSTLVYFIPGVNLLGMAVSSVTASMCARGIGRRFVEHFETGASLTDFPVVDRRRPTAAAAS
jgi:uncharacterized protein (DUF697 family)